MSENLFVKSTDPLLSFFFHLGRLFSEGRVSPSQIRAITAALRDGGTAPLPLPAAPPLPELVPPEVTSLPEAKTQAEGSTALAPVRAVPEGYLSTSEVVQRLNQEGRLERLYRRSLTDQGKRVKSTPYSASSLSKEVVHLAKMLRIYPFAHDGYEPPPIDERFVALASLSSARVRGGAVEARVFPPYVTYSPKAVEAMSSLVAKLLK